MKKVQQAKVEKALAVFSAKMVEYTKKVKAGEHAKKSKGNGGCENDEGSEAIQGGATKAKKISGDTGAECAGGSRAEVAEVAQRRGWGRKQQDAII